jgi:uncharacterized linocin/CFP29 family protein
MNHLLREKAPISDAAWAEIEEEATRTFKHFLTARRLVDFNGLDSWNTDAAPRGRVAKLSEAPEGVKARIRAVQPLVEYKAKFSIDRRELSAIDRGARDANLDAVRDAARHLALAEDSAVFIGHESASITGITHATTNERLPISDNYSEYPGQVARAVALLQSIGVGGPYAVALGPRCFTGVIETTEFGGYPVLEHLRLIAGGPVLWAPAVDGAVVLSTRGDDFELTVGQDASIGYSSHDDDEVRLYLEESLTFQVLTPEAAVHLVYT